MAVLEEGLIMDQNLTGIAILAGPLSAGIGALAVYYASKRTQDAQLRIEEIKIKKSIRNSKIQAYCDLIGCSHSMLQYYNSYLFSVIAVEILILHARIIAIKGIDLTPVKEFLLHGKLKRESAEHYFNEKYGAAIAQSIDLKEGLRARERTLDLEIQLGETTERFWRSIGQVKALFPDAEVSKLVEEINAAEKDLELVEGIQNAFNKISVEINEYSSIISANISTEPSNKDFNKIRDDWANKMELGLGEIHDLKTSIVNTKVRTLDSKAKNLQNYLEKLVHATQ